MTDAEKFVREKYPCATCIGPMRNGRYHPDGGYGIVLNPYSSFSSSHGDTVIAAWADMANKLQSQVGEHQITKQPHDWS